MALIRFKRGTRAELDAAAAANELTQGEPYYITDEDGYAIGSGVDSYVDFNIGNWDTAYTYSQIGHLEGPGGTTNQLQVNDGSGGLAGAANVFADNGGLRVGSAAGTTPTGQINAEGVQVDGVDVLKVGDFGVGEEGVGVNLPIDNFTTETPPGGLFRYRADLKTDSPETGAWNHTLLAMPGATAGHVNYLAVRETSSPGGVRGWLAHGREGTDPNWKELWHSGNLAAPMEVGDFGWGGRAVSKADGADDSWGTTRAQWSIDSNDAAGTGIDWPIIVNFSRASARNFQFWLPSLGTGAPEVGFRYQGSGGAVSDVYNFWHSGNLADPMEVGDFGVGSLAPPSLPDDLDDLDLNIWRSGFYSSVSAKSNLAPGANSNGAAIVWRRAGEGNNTSTHVLYGGREGSLFYRVHTTGWQPWRELWHSGNLADPMEVGDFGLGATSDDVLRVTSQAQEAALDQVQFYQAGSAANTMFGRFGGGLVIPGHNDATRGLLYFTAPSTDDATDFGVYFAKYRDDTIGFRDPLEVWHSGNLEVDSETITLGNDFGSGSGSQVKCVRTGDQVTITATEELTHTNDSQVSSSSGVIPTKYRPAGIVSVMASPIGANIGGGFTVAVTSGGEFILTHLDANGDLIARPTSNGHLPTITYGV